MQRVCRLAPWQPGMGGVDDTRFHTARLPAGRLGARRAGIAQWVKLTSKSFFCVMNAPKSALSPLSPRPGLLFASKYLSCSGCDFAPLPSATPCIACTVATSQAISSGELG